jgi:hypothetical protein
MVVLGFALGHLVSINQYQADRMIAAINLHALAPRNEGNEEFLMSRKLMALMMLSALACASVLAARRPAEVAVMALALYSALGIVVSGEHADLGYEKSQWPLMPWLRKGSPGVMTAAFLGMLGVALVLVWREMQAQAPARQKKRKRSDEPRQRTTHRMQPRARVDREEEDERASTED